MDSGDNIEHIDANVVVLNPGSNIEQLKDATFEKVICIKPLLPSGSLEPPVVQPSLEAAPLPSYDYDSIDIYKTHMCAFSVIETEGQTFEEYEALYNPDGPFVPYYPDLLQKSILQRRNM